MRSGDTSLGRERRRAARCARRRYGPVLALLCLPVQVHAAQVLGVQVRREGGQFQIGMEVAIDAPPPAVFRALTDYPALPRYSHSIRTVRVKPTGDPNREQLYTTMHVCVLFFCRTMREEQIMTATATRTGGVLRATLVSQGSAFRSGHGSWTVKPCAAARNTACMDVRLELVPAFWVPPVIGPWLIRRRMYAEARRTSVALQRLALKVS